MSLTVVAIPASEAELSVMLCELEAMGIPALVQNGGFGALYPGNCNSLLTARRIMVPSSFAAQAVEALQVFTQPLQKTSIPTPGDSDVFGRMRQRLTRWFRLRGASDSSESSDSSS